MNIKNIPNMLTLTRIISTPIIVILLFLKQYIIALILAIIGAITDMLDGKIARKYNVVSVKGAKLDDIADKLFAISLLFYLSFNNVSNFKFNPAIIILILEVLISILNTYIHLKTNITKTLMIGKVKTVCLFISIILSVFLSFNSFFKTFTTALLFTTINLQCLTFISYLKNYLILKNKLHKSVK